MALLALEDVPAELLETHGAFEGYRRGGRGGQGDRGSFGMVVIVIVIALSAAFGGSARVVAVRDVSLVVVSASFRHH